MWTLSSVSTLWTRNEYTEHKGRHTIASRLALVLWYVRLFRFISLHFDIFFSTVHPCFCPEFFLPFIIIFHFIWCYCVCRWEPTARYTLLYSVRCRLFNAHSQFALFHLIRFSSLLFFSVVPFRLWPFHIVRYVKAQAQAWANNEYFGWTFSENCCQKQINRFVHGIKWTESWNCPCFVSFTTA